MANNNQALFKTTLEGELLWSVYNRPTQDVSKTTKNNSTHCAFGSPNGYCPTWFEHQPGSPYLYMTDGYGSNKMFIYGTDGKFTGTSVGGTGGPNQHGPFDCISLGGDALVSKPCPCYACSRAGKFNIAHSISWDPRREEMAVSDRVNHRLEYFKIDAKDPTKFDYSSTTMLDFEKPNTGLVCNVRFLNDTWAISPTLEGPVFIMDKENKLLSTVPAAPCSYSYLQRASSAVAYPFAHNPSHAHCFLASLAHAAKGVSAPSLCRLSALCGGLDQAG